MDLLHVSMEVDDRIVVLTADLGFGLLDQIRRSFQGRFWNVGAAEQLMIGAAIGLAESGKIPICYSMSSFILYRPFEMLRNYVNYEKIPIKMIGSGRDMDYSHDGISHWAHDDHLVLQALPCIEMYKPPTIHDLEEIWPVFLYGRNPAYLNLTRRV